MNSPKYVVAQIGARRGYAVPEILASAGMLSQFYTDVCGNVGLGRVLALGRMFSTDLARLANRRVPITVHPITRTFPFLTALHICRWRGGSDWSNEAIFRANLEWQCELGKAATRYGFRDATHLFSMLGEFPTLLISAKERGLKVVSEVYILLSTERIVADERRLFPGWESEFRDLSPIRREVVQSDALLTRSDFFVCPSSCVQADLVVNYGVDTRSTALVPYGVSPAILEHRPSPTRGRVLFVGSAELRKGIHYLALAAERLRMKKFNLEFRIAGNVSRAVAQQPACRHLTFIGRIPRVSISKEFQSADVFVLPTLAEGSAEVTYEALASGLPVITTKSAGSVVRHGVEGIIVPERDPDALASAIEELTEDRARRDRMANAARERAAEFTWSRYRQRLLECLTSLPR
jgi:glycosyltransferase involved in cell wall biosynthesis